MTLCLVPFFLSFVAFCFCVCGSASASVCLDGTYRFDLEGEGTNVNLGVTAAWLVSCCVVLCSCLVFRCCVTVQSVMEQMWNLVPQMPEIRVRAMK